MPQIHIRITDEGTTNEHKAPLIECATQMLVDVLEKNPATTFVTIEEVPPDNLGIADESVTIDRHPRA